MTTISLETLQDGSFRVTVRVDGRTSKWFEGGNSKDLVQKALSFYDVSCIRLNDAAKTALNSKELSTKLPKDWIENWKNASK